MRALVLLLLVVALGGCAALRPEADQAITVSDIVADAVAATLAGGAAQRRLLASAQQAFASDPGDASRLRLATLLAALPAPHGDEARAHTLLTPLAEGQPQSPYGRFAALLAGQLATRARVSKEAERVVRTGEQREEALRQQHEALRQQQDLLRQQLESLKSIERSILEREETMRRKQR